jgi:hypothetical protein
MVKQSLLHRVVSSCCILFVGKQEGRVIDLDMVPGVGRSEIADK